MYTESPPLSCRRRPRRWRLRAAYRSRIRPGNIPSRLPEVPSEPLAKSRRCLKAMQARGSASKIGASVIDILANSKIRSDSVKRMTQIQNTS